MIKIMVCLVKNKNNKKKRLLKLFSSTNKLDQLVTFQRVSHRINPDE